MEGNIANNVKEALDKTNFSEVLDKIKDNPEEVNKLAAESAGLMTPEMIEQAKNYALGSQGEKIKKEMEKKGMNNRDMKQQAIQQKKLYDQLESKKKGDLKKVILITSAKKLVEKTVHCNIIAEDAKKLITCDAIEMNCGRLAQGPLQGEKIKVWYDPNNKYKNARASKIIGFDIGGSLLILMENGDINQEKFLKVEKSLEY